MFENITFCFTSFFCDLRWWFWKSLKWYQCRWWAPKDDHIDANCFVYIMKLGPHAWNMMFWTRTVRANKTNMKWHVNMQPQTLNPTICFNVLFGMIFTYFHIVCCNEHAGYGVSCVQQDFRNRYRSEWNGLFFLWWKTTMCCNIVRKHFWEKQIIDMVPCQYIAPMDCDIVWTYISDRYIINLTSIN